MKPDRIKEKMNTMRKVILTVAMIIILGSVTAKPLGVYADDPQDITVSVTVNQSFTGSDTADKTGDYRITGLKGTTHMPQGVTGSTYDFSMTGSAATRDLIFTFAPDAYGTYQYMTEQVSENTDQAYTYDRSKYYITITIKAPPVPGNDDSRFSVIVTDEDGNKKPFINYANACRTPGGPDPVVTADPPVEKVIEGTPPSDAYFTFEMVADDPSYPMPEGSENGKKTMIIQGAGSGEFGISTYTQPGVYTYTVREINTGEAGYTYDTTVYTVTNTVTLENNELKLNQVITKNAQNAPTVTPDVTRIPAPTTTPTVTPDVTGTPAPSSSPAPTATPSATPEVTVTPDPTATPTVTDVPQTFTTCRFVNRYGTATITPTVTPTVTPRVTSVTKPSQQGTSGKPSPITGDDTDMTGWIIALIAAAAVATVLIIKAGKNRNSSSGRR